MLDWRLVRICRPERCTSARSIPQTHPPSDPAAARELNYRPNFSPGLCARNELTTIGLIVEEIGDAYGSMIISVSKLPAEAQLFFSDCNSPPRPLHAARLFAPSGWNAGGRIHHCGYESARGPALRRFSAGHRALEGVTTSCLTRKRECA